MAGSPEYCVVLPLAPLQVGRWIDRRAWPLHLTLVPNVRSNADLDTLVGAVREAARGLPALATIISHEAWFDPDGSTLVDLAGVDDLRPAHEAVLDALQQHAGAVPVVPEHHRDGYRPHVTVTPGARAQRGERPTFRTIALVELGTEGRAGTAAPLALLDLAATDPPDVPSSMPRDAVVALLRDLTERGVQPWVIGGWGVDALLGHPSRVHHDLDVFVDVAELPALLTALPEIGMTVRFVWSENRWIGDHHLPSAFVADGPRGELDVHVVRLGPDGPVPLSASHVSLPRDALEGIGTIEGTPVRCATPEAQLVMHTGYELPEQHRADIERLRALIA
ncbi:MAG TPA: 2'-5' RNA ligase family protein [Amnibacterium sp.]|uniref:nucleotidyltransferase domain-containing protein n=1 Tax=Amnibacterium sp. TaxID=1872496 RepID=UPI002F92442E